MHIHHIAIAVKDLDKALEFYRDAMGVEVVGRREVPAEGVEIAFLPMGEAEIELLRPLHPDNSIGRFLEKRGEGIHHVCVLVEDIEAAAARLEENGARLLSDIKQHADGTRYVFIHPKSAYGVLMELYQKPRL